MITGRMQCIRSDAVLPDDYRFIHVGFRDNVMRSRFSFHVDLGQILSDNAEAKQLEAADK